ncbi:MAG TPA: peroxidase-related enzyme [Vitreimonas sp.]|uniref:carboxymuconolactone decarboxylase family protein n=1 Tax=Vitreimonas sp. TaxID=3069702 RepID=UPI002D71CDC8|nr:peroxidase-related enzyme [Vitreimonas sp.]HYD87820.1 peroxidase-related enzyme [Vitreimonas sp.]
MALVEPLPANADAEVAELARFFNETLGFPPNSVLTMQRRPEIAKAFIALNKAVMANAGRVTSEQKRLIGLVASQTAGCRYCQAHTARAAERYGASHDRIAEVWNYERSDLFTPAEKAALAFAQAAASTPNAVDHHVAASLKAYWTDEEIVEILGVVALFGYLNRWNDSMATTIEPGAAESGGKLLAARGWAPGKHGAA